MQPAAEQPTVEVIGVEMQMEMEMQIASHRPSTFQDSSSALRPPLLPSPPLHWTRPLDSIDNGIPIVGIPLDNASCLASIPAMPCPGSKN